MADVVKHMDIKEFHELGFLQEANRQFFHPHGLALEIRVSEDGSESLGGIWDCREDPEGVVFGNGGYGDSMDRARAVDAERVRHFEHRCKLFGNEHVLPQEGDDVALPEDWPDVEPLDWTYPEQGE
jgi:hypothetical protein